MKDFFGKKAQVTSDELVQWGSGCITYAHEIID